MFTVLNFHPSKQLHERVHKDSLIVLSVTLFWLQPHQDHLSGFPWQSHKMQRPEGDSPATAQLSGTEKFHSM